MHTKENMVAMGIFPAAYMSQTSIVEVLGM